MGEKGYKRGGRRKESVREREKGDKLEGEKRLTGRQERVNNREREGK